ncbi:S41 family peptidase [Chiayiivirga flava]|uniref:Carboxyl-terminal processing protease n=1 Tax=Chiayiivirga flava TaxID=659595 RepID=A0A7W8G3A1_9GAMM|nr:S41 family peptidase [Chiayiivirga flava]MBB5209585.1 carboxyl-terminal processing protease [Chiayiivirga flava]
MKHARIHAVPRARAALLVLLLGAVPLAFAQGTPADDAPGGDRSGPEAPPDLAPAGLPPVEADSPALRDPPDAAAQTAAEERVSLDEIRRFVSVFRAVKQAYVDPIDDETLMRAAIRGLLIDLDPHSAYLDREESQSLNEQASGAYDGLGLEVLQQPDRSLLVISPIDDTPAARAGIKPGDIITAIDGKAIDADNTDAAADSMRGEPGSKIRLTVMRETAAEPLQFTLTRETIRVASVRTELLEPGYGYLRIATFQADTGIEITKKLKALQAQNKAPLRGLVLDLRSNPGGLLHAAVEAADAFLDEGIIVTTKGRLPYANAEFRARDGDLLDGAPITILADSGTASAAEVLAGALRDHQRALVMGEPTFGKGSVQTVLPMDNGDSIKMTTARYYTPDGTSIQAAGIAPDVPLGAQAQARATEQPPTVRERDLPGHLRGDNELDPEPADGFESIPVDPPAIVELDDSAVREALNLLKGLAVFGERKKPAGG